MSRRLGVLVLLLWTFVACDPAAPAKRPDRPARVRPASVAATTTTRRPAVAPPPTAAATTTTTTTTSTTSARTNTTAAPTTTPTTRAGLSNDNTYVNSDGQVVHSPAYSPDGPPPGATAQCNDGTYSFSTHRSGTCSHHGGVARWL